MNYLKRCLIFVLAFVVVFCLMYFVAPNFYDELWNYGFAYNISTGLVPYKDFNMIVTPLYPFIASVFITFFGHHLWSVYILDVLIIVFMIFVMYRHLGNRVWIFLPVIFYIGFPGYNFFSLFLMIVLLEICNIELKNSDIFIAVIVSFLFLTKQTIGIFCFIPMIFYAKNKLRSFVAFLIPILIFIIYLLYNNAFYNFIDYCFLGMFDFTSKNVLYLFLPLEIIIVLSLVILFIKTKFLDKSLAFIIMYQIITLPICDPMHFLTGLFVVIYYLFWNFKVNKFLSVLVLLFFITFFSKYEFYFNLYDDNKSFLYGRNFYVNSDFVNYMCDYLENFNDVYDNVYLVFDIAYLLKLNTGIPINKFDLINNGNMGYDGANRYIDEIDNTCKSNESCVFVVDIFTADNLDNFYDLTNSQVNLDIFRYVVNNYNKIDENKSFYFYSNVNMG